MTSIEDLLGKGRIEPVEADPTTATQRLEDTGRHLDAATKTADLDPSGAYVLAYDAARKSVAAPLLMTGHRVRSRPGSHQALAQHANTLTTQAGEDALKRFDRLRRNRNRSEYGSKTFGKEEVSEAMNTAGDDSGGLPKDCLTPTNKLSREAERNRCGWTETIECSTFGL